MAGVQLPSFIADEEVTASSDGVMTVGRLVGGVALGAGIIAVGVRLFNGAATAAGQDNITMTVG